MNGPAFSFAVPPVSPSMTNLPVSGRIVALLALLALPAVPRALAQFTISTTVNTAQTLTTGLGTVTGTGAISIASGSTVPLTMTGTSTLVNNGTIQTLGTGRAIDSNSGTANLTVTNIGLISSVSADAFRINTAGSSVSLTNSGTIRVTAGGQAIDWATITTGTNSLNNQATGFITAVGEDAVRPGQNGTITNAGTIAATPTVSAGVVSGSDGIDLRTEKTVTVTNSGVISGRHGIATDGANVGPSSLTVNNNAGTVQALNGSGLNVDGVNTSVTANVTNAFGATIKGGVLASATNGDGDGIDVDGVLTLNNSGDVLALGAKGVGSDTLPNNADGIALGGGSITNTATGRIIGSTLLEDAPNGDTSRAGNGILVDNSSGGNAIAATTVTNSGLIEGKTGVGIRIVGTFADTITNNAGGTIRGASTGAAIQTGDGADTLNNSGTIQNTSSGGAIALEGGSDTLNILGGAAVIAGNIDGGTGTNTMNVDPGVGNTFSYAGQITNFNAVNVGAGTFSLAGSATVDAFVSVGSGGILGGTGTLLQSVSVQSGGVIAAGNSPGTLNIAGNLDVVAGAGFNFELGATPAASDLIAVSGMLNFVGPGTLTFNILNLGLVPGTYDLITFSSSSGLALANLAFGATPLGFVGNFLLDGDSVSLVVTAIPEPSIYALVLGCGALGVAAFRRRKMAA